MQGCCCDAALQLQRCGSSCGPHGTLINGRSSSSSSVGGGIGSGSGSTCGAALETRSASLAATQGRRGDLLPRPAPVLVTARRPRPPRRLCCVWPALCARPSTCTLSRCARMLLTRPPAPHALAAEPALLVPGPQHACAWQLAGCCCPLSCATALLPSLPAALQALRDWRRQEGQGACNVQPCCNNPMCSVACGRAMCNPAAVLLARCCTCCRWCPCGGGPV